MALITPVQTSIAGAVATPAAVTSSDTFKPGDRLALFVNNGSASSINVTITVPGNTKYGQANPAVVVAVPATSAKVIGPFPADLANPTTGVVTVAYSATATVTARLIRV